MKFEDIVYDRLMGITELTDYEKQIIDDHFKTFLKVYLLGCLDVK